MPAYKIVYLGKIIILLFIIFLFVSCSAQNEITTHNFQTIELKEYYNGKGAIVPAITKEFIPGVSKKRINLNIEQVKIAEEILREDIHNYKKKYFDDGRFYFWQYCKKNEDTVKLLLKYVREAQIEIKEFYRYYVGFINDKNEEIIKIYLFNSKQVKSEFENWQDEYIFGTGEFFEKNTRIYFINLAKREIEYKRLE